MKKLITCLFTLIPFTIKAQPKAAMMDSKLNEQFDRIVLTHTRYPVTKTQAFPQSDISPKNQADGLKYNPALELWDNKLKEILDNGQYSETEKIQFIKDALSDTSRDAFKNINNSAIRFWRSSAEAEALMEAYFKKAAFDTSSDPVLKFKHFEFRIQSLFSDAYDLITRYFRERNTLETKYWNEGDLVYRLLELNKEQEAVQYLEMLMEEYMNGKIKRLGLGSRDPAYYDGFVFDFLCFSSNREVVQKATDLLFRLLEQKDYETFYLYKLSSYLDKKRHIKLLEKKFEHFSKIDFSPIDLGKLSDPAQKPDYELVPEADAFFSFMYDNSNFLGITKGRELWQKFATTMPYWNLYGQSFEMIQMYILENAFQDKSLSVEEKKKMLVQVKKTEQLFNSRDYWGDYPARFLKLVLQAYPDMKMPKADFDKLELSRLLTYTLPLHIDKNQLVVTPYRTKLDNQAITKIVTDVNAFAKATGLRPIELSGKERFFLSLESTESCFFDYFKKNESIVSFDAEGFEGSYVDFYESNFLPVLSKYNIHDIQISQKTEKANKEEYKYRIYIKSKRQTYLFEYTERRTEWYEPQRLVKMLNLCLRDLKVPQRFMEIASGDQTALFFFSEPGKLKPPLDKYNIGYWAISTNDGFQGINY